MDVLVDDYWTCRKGSMPEKAKAPFESMRAVLTRFSLEQSNAGAFDATLKRRSSVPALLSRDAECEARMCGLFVLRITRVSG